jgi:hypothetical protein
MVAPTGSKHTYSTNQGASQIPPSGWSRRSLHNTFEGHWLIKHTKVMNNGCIFSGFDLVSNKGALQSTTLNMLISVGNTNSRRKR